ncbi:patatin-like phospholipase family protein [Azospirillum canadense]|uniref:patatin-like phospholipase family protein n=1 Tax=Azospirillum canadense TaxID=403962 RepID=UPI0022268DB8|nr:patatin-like phospholipase family protein [Azospirillum canadense]MCW2243105.1 putative patatin/cPLA2 family phospholipase [Azospirillum canadense]
MRSLRRVPPLRGALSALAGVLFVLLTATGCGTPTRLDAVPVASEAKASVVGMPEVRYWGDDEVSDFQRDALESVRRERDLLQQAGHRGPLPPADFLAISGGGEDGAFGAGLLVGWSAAGTRPRFKGVTGISTGALIAPFAFLGPAYDDKLKEVYTTITNKDILEQRGFLAALNNDAMADTAPLRKLVQRIFDQPMLDAIAAEHEKGRILLIGTTNLDARRPVIWNVTKIAASRHPLALELVQTLLVASAAIPGAFPPVMISVEADGKRFEEMHVDGGATAQVFVYPPGLNLKAEAQRAGIVRQRRLYVIRNARLDPDWAQVDRQTLSIANRAIASLIQTQGVGDLYRIYIAAQRDGIDFNLAYIPESFKTPLREPFDPVYMKDLFKIGYDLAANGYPWAKTPPGYAAPQVEPPIPPTTAGATRAASAKRATAGAGS